MAPSDEVATVPFLPTAMKRWPVQIMDSKEGEIAPGAGDARIRFVQEAPFVEL
jgi:hypothetical protein